MYFDSRDELTLGLTTSNEPLDPERFVKAGDFGKKRGNSRESMLRQYRSPTPNVRWAATSRLQFLLGTRDESTNDLTRSKGLS